MVCELIARLPGTQLSEIEAGNVLGIGRGGMRGFGMGL